MVRSTIKYQQFICRTN